MPRPPGSGPVTLCFTLVTVFALGTWGVGAAAMRVGLTVAAKMPNAMTGLRILGLGYRRV